MAAIPTILKGDDSGAITLTLATGRTYTGATLIVAYQGVTRTFTDLTPGGTVTLTYTHDETSGFELKTAPILMRLVGSTGGEETVENAEARIKVTDCLSEVNAGGSFVVTPGGTITDPTKVPITDVEDLASRYTMAQLAAKVNQIVHVLAQRSLLSVVAVCGTFAALADLTVQTARLDSLYNDSLVVTNVSGSGSSTDPGVVSNIVEAYGYATTNYVNDAIASATPGDYANVSNRAYAAPVEFTWSAPDEWMLKFVHGGSTSRSVTGGCDYEGWRIISNAVVSTTFYRNAQTKAVTVDETSTAIPNVTNWSASTGATITSAGLVAASVDGVYRVTATTADGSRHGDVILQGETTITETNSFYAADVAYSGTKAVNDQALAQLNAATKVGDYTRGGKTYSVYNSQKVYITQVGAGNVKPFAVSAHILGSAAHYPSHIRWLGTQTFTDANGNSATVTKKRWVNLADWALENGWSKAEITLAGVSDIAMVICDTATAVPDGCIPYFLPPTALFRYYDGVGLQAWQCSQFHEYAMPVTLTDWNSAIVAYDTFRPELQIRSDIYTRLMAMGQQNYLVSGDSGKPYFMIDRNGQTVVLFANTIPYSGANWVTGYYIIKAFVEAQGDTLKEAN